MRLTVHHSAELLPYWLDSLNKLLASDGFNPAQFRHLGEWHLATFKAWSWSSGTSFLSLVSFTSGLTVS